MSRHNDPACMQRLAIEPRIEGAPDGYDTVDLWSSLRLLNDALTLNAYMRGGIDQSYPEGVRYLAILNGRYERLNARRSYLMTTLEERMKEHGV
jgi:hypothetical protein